MVWEGGSRKAPPYPDRHAGMAQLHFSQHGSNIICDLTSPSQESHAHVEEQVDERERLADNLAFLIVRQHRASQHDSTMQADGAAHQETAK